jgi:hypothetical protein
LVWKSANLSGWSSRLIPVTYCNDPAAMVHASRWPVILLTAT